MYAFLTGLVDEINDNSVVINCNGVGYEVFCSASTLAKLSVDAVATVYTYLQVREDAVCLYGFADKQEKNVFLNLISVSGIGPKIAVQILSSITPSDLVTAIINGDIKLISTVKGLGKKTAERLVLELKNSFDDATKYAFNQNANYVISSATDEATEVLVGMGLNRMDAIELVRLVAEPDDTTEIIITKALKNRR